MIYGRGKSIASSWLIIPIMFFFTFILYQLDNSVYIIWLLGSLFLIPAVIFRTYKESKIKSKVKPLTQEIRAQRKIIIGSVAIAVSEKESSLLKMGWSNIGQLYFTEAGFEFYIIFGKGKDYNVFIPLEDITDVSAKKVNVNVSTSSGEMYKFGCDSKKIALAYDREYRNHISNIYNKK